MRNFERFGRRGLLRLAAMGVAARLGAEEKDLTSVSKRVGREFGGLKVGLASYSCRKLGVDDTIAICRRAGIGHIALKSAHLPLSSSREQRLALREKFRDAGIVIEGCGVIYLKAEDAIRPAFEYVRDLGANTAVIGIAEPMVAAVDKAVREFDLRVAIHNHGPNDKSGAFSPLVVMEWLKGTDARMGACMDVGHTYRCGLNPAAVARKCAARLHDIHIKDLDAMKKPVPVGQGRIDIVGLLKTLEKMHYGYHLALEYETDAANPAPGIGESIGYERGVLAVV